MTFQRYFLISTLVIFYLSCSEQRCDCILPQSKQEYEFNIELLSNPDFLDYWREFDESLLHFQEYECYRLSFVSPLEEIIKIYRIQQTQSGFEFVVKEYNYHPSNESTNLISNKVDNLSRKEWLILKEYINKKCFWTMPIEDDKNGLDGVVYSLEGFDPTGNLCTNKKYHTVSRWSPDSTSRFMNLCKRISSLEMT